MRLLYISNSLIPSNIANSINVIKMSSSLSNYFKSIHLIGKKNNLINQNIFKFYSVKRNFELILYKEKKFKILNDFNLIFISLINILKLEPDVIYLRNIKLAFLFLFFKKIIVLELHNSINSKSESFFFNKLIKYKKKLHIICISDALKNYYMENYCTRNLTIDIHTLHDGSDDILNKIQKNDQAEIIFNKNFNIGYFGSLYSGRGIELIIKIADHFPSFLFHIFGGTNEDVNQFSKFKKNNIVFYGYVSPHKAEISMCLMDCLLAPFQKKVSVFGNKGDTSKWMSPLKIFNYMSARKPIIVSDIVVLREVLKNNYNALMCNPENENEWIESIKNVYENKKLREYLSENAYNDYLKLYSWDKRAKKVSSIINKYETK